MHNCVVVGHQRVCPILVVELETSVDASTVDLADKVKGEIIARTASFNERLFAHERITSPTCILVVPTGSLPRTTVSWLSLFRALLFISVVIPAGERQREVSFRRLLLGCRLTGIQEESNRRPLQSRNREDLYVVGVKLNDRHRTCIITVLYQDPVHYFSLTDKG